MAPSFGRSISFPLSPARSSSRAAARHVRSVSLPSCRAHPLLAHLQTTTRAVRAWASTAAADPTTTAAANGLAHLDALHAALAELLLLPEARAALAAGAATAGCLLDGSLALADAHGAFREALLDLRRGAADLQAALRRRDAARLASAARAQRHAEKDLARLASSVRAAAKLPHQLLLAGSATAAEFEVSGVLTEAVAAVASASAAVFSAVEAVSSAATTAAASSSKKAAAALISLVTRSKAAAASSDEDRKMAALDKLEELDECIANMEAGSDKVFRSILQTRIALLNIHTQTC